MPEFTFIVRLDPSDDPTAAALIARAGRAAEAFGGTLVAWETGSALDRLRGLQEQHDALRSHLLSHGLLAEGADDARPRPVAGAVVVAGGAAAPPPPGPPPPFGASAGPGLPPPGAALLTAAVRGDLTQLAHAVGALASTLRAHDVEVPERVLATVRRLTSGGVTPGRHG